MESIGVHQDSQSSFTVIDCKRVLTCAEDNLVTLVNLETQEIATSETNEAKWAIASQLQPLSILRLSRYTDLTKIQDRVKNKSLVAIGSDKSVDIYSWSALQTILDKRTPQSLEDVDREDGFATEKMVQKITFSKDSKWIIASDCSSTLQLQKPAKKLLATVCLEATDGIRAFDLSVDGKNLCIITFDTVFLQVLDKKKKVVSKKEVDYKKAFANELEPLKFNNNTMMSFSQDAKFLFLPLGNKVIRYSVDNTDEQEEIVSIGTESIIMVSASFDDKYLFVQSRNQNTNFLRMVDLNGKSIQEEVETKSQCLDMKVFLNETNQYKVVMNTDFGDLLVHTFGASFVPQKELIRQMVHQEEDVAVDEDMGEQEQKMERLRCVTGDNCPSLQRKLSEAAEKGQEGLKRKNDTDEGQVVVRKAARNKTFAGTNQHLAATQNGKKLMAWTTLFKVVQRTDAVQNVQEVRQAEIKRTNLCLAFPLGTVQTSADVSDDQLLLYNICSLQVRHLNTNDWWSFAFEECDGQEVAIVSASVSNELVFVQLSGKSEVRVLNAYSGMQMASLVCDRGVFKLASCNERTYLLRESPSGEVYVDVLTLRGQCLFQLDKNIYVGSAKILQVGFLRAKGMANSSRKTNAKRLLLHDSYGRVLMVNVVSSKMHLIPLCSLPQNVFILGCEDSLCQLELTSFDDQPENAKFLEIYKGAPTVEFALSSPVQQEIQISPEDANVAKQPQESSLGQTAEAVEVQKTARLRLMQMEFERVCKGDQQMSERDQERTHDKTVITAFKELLQFNEMKLATELLKSLKMEDSFEIAAQLLKVLGLDCFLYKVEAVKEMNLTTRKAFEEILPQPSNLDNMQNDWHFEQQSNAMEDVTQEQSNQNHISQQNVAQNKPMKNQALESLKNASREHLTEMGIKNTGFGALKTDFKRKQQESNKDNKNIKF